MVAISPEYHSELAYQAFGDLIVIRWCETFDKSGLMPSIKGISGTSVNFDQLKGRRLFMCLKIISVQLWVSGKTFKTTFEACNG